MEAGRKFSQMSMWERRMFGFGAFVMAAVAVLFHPDDTLNAVQKLLAAKLGNS